MSDADDRRLLQRYAAANAALDEAPSEPTRAAILAAAARAVGARPRSADRPRRWRIPLAAAASLLIGTIAVLLATRLDESVPDVSTLAAPTTPRTGSPAAEAAPGRDAADAAPVRIETRAPKAMETPAGPRRLRPEQPPLPAREDARVDRALAPTAPEAAGSHAAAASAVAGTPTAPAEMPTGAARTVAPRASASASKSPAAGEATGAEPPWRSSTETWLKRIAELRAHGRHDAADAELTLLRARHPDLRPPPAALPPLTR